MYRCACLDRARAESVPSFDRRVSQRGEAGEHAVLLSVPDGHLLRGGGVGGPVKVGEDAGDAREEVFVLLRGLLRLVALEGAGEHFALDGVHPAAESKRGGGDALGDGVFRVEGHLAQVAETRGGAAERVVAARELRMHDGPHRERPVYVELRLGGAGGIRGGQSRGWDARRRVPRKGIFRVGGGRRART